jgi:hypothetical protein
MPTDRVGSPITPACGTESLAEIVARALHPAYSSGPLDARGLGQVVSAIGDVLASGGLDLESSLRPHSAGPSTETRPESGRAYAKLMEAPHLELWLIEWGPSTFLDLHDHGGAIGAIRVLSGNLVEAFTDLTSRSPMQDRLYGAGDQSTFSSDHVHEIWNPAGEAALTLHGYTPRLSQMTFYDHSESSFLEPLRTEVFLQAA